MGLRLLVFVAASLFGLAPTAASAQVQSRTHAAPVPPVFVVAAAKREAATLGDSHPTSAVYALTRRQVAVRMSSGGRVNSNEAVYLVVLRGDFTTVVDGPTSPGTTVHGTVASIVLDASSGRDTDFSIGRQPISTAGLSVTGNLLPYFDGSKRPVCDAPDLRASASFQGATGSQLGGLRITNTSALACALPARATVSLAWHGRQLAIKQSGFPSGWLARMNPRWGSSLHLLQPRQGGEVVLQWFNWCGRSPWSNDAFRPTVRLDLIGQLEPVSAATSEAMAAPFCEQKPTEGNGSTMRVSPFLRPA